MPVACPVAAFAGDASDGAKANVDRAIQIGSPDLLSVLANTLDDIAMWMPIAVAVPDGNQDVWRLGRVQEGLAR